MTVEIKKDYFVHQSALVEDGASIGKGTKIWCFSHVLSGATIGENCVLGQNVCVCSTAIIGNKVKLQNNVSVYDEVILEDYVFCGPSAVFTNVINPRSEIERKHEYMKTLVKKGATIGANATILCGITIGQYSFIAAGATVTKDVPDFALMVGSPAKIKGWMCICGNKIEFKKNAGCCTACDKKYSKTGFQVDLITCNV